MDFGLCGELNSVPPKFTFGSPNPQATELGDKSFRKKLQLNEVIRVGS